jgi:hypothetical protein
MNLYKCATLVFKPFLIVVFGRDTCVAIEGLAFGRALVLFGRTLTLENQKSMLPNRA